MIDSAKFKATGLAALLFFTSGCGRKEHQAAMLQRDEAAAQVINKLSKDPILLEFRRLLQDEIKAASALDFPKLLTASDKTAEFLTTNQGLLTNLAFAIPVPTGGELTRNEMILLRIGDSFELLRDRKHAWSSVVSFVYDNIPGQNPGTD